MAVVSASASLVVVSAGAGLAGALAAGHMGGWLGASAVLVGWRLPPVSYLQRGKAQHRPPVDTGGYITEIDFLCSRIRSRKLPRCQ